MAKKTARSTAPVASKSVAPAWVRKMRKEEAARLAVVRRNLMADASLRELLMVRHAPPAGVASWDELDVKGVVDGLMYSMNNPAWIREVREEEAAVLTPAKERKVKRLARAYVHAVMG